MNGRGEMRRRDEAHEKEPRLELSGDDRLESDPFGFRCAVRPVFGPTITRGDRGGTPSPSTRAGVSSWSAGLLAGVETRLQEKNHGRPALSLTNPILDETIPW